jgi:5-methylcytosine-specific restriction endonuclease McrA
MIQRIKDIIQGKIKLRDRRSSKWSRIRNIHLKEKPKCAACGGHKKLEVHHIKPFNKYPELELEPSNLITLCESKKNGVNCHLLFGHLGNYKTINPTVLEDVLTWFNKITQR